MRRANRRVVLAGLAAGFAGACTAPARIVEGGKKSPEGGIGGTGIVGTLTGFGSLYVNGLRVETAASTAITDALGPIPQSALAVGHSLTIEAADDAGQLVARRVHVTHPVIGPVRSISPDRSLLDVAGVPVRARPESTSEIGVGAVVAVSGLWDGASVVASRLDVRRTGDVSVVAGAVTRDPQTQALSIGGAVSLEGAVDPSLVGSFVTATGVSRSEAFVLQDLQTGRFTGAAGPLARLSVEGYLDPTPDAPFYTVSGLGHSFDGAARLAPFETGRTIFSGDYIETFVVQTGVPLPDDAAARADVLVALQEGRGASLARPAR